MRKIFVVIIFMLIAIPVYAHVYDPNDGIADFEDYELDLIRAQEGTAMWWGYNWDEDMGIYPYCDAEIELDPEDINNKVLNIVGQGPYPSGASYSDDWLWIDGIIHEPGDGTWIVAAFDLWLEAGIGTGDKRLTVTFYDNDSSDPVNVSFGKTTPGQITNKTGGSHVPVSGYSFNDETWMRVRIILNQSADTIDLFIDGELLLKDANIENDAISCERLVFSTRDNNERILIDNLVTEVHSTPPPFCGDGTHAWLDSDISGPEGKPDCYVDIYDLDAMTKDWLDCADPSVPLCN